MSPKKILVSACLLGEQVRYDNEVLPDRPSMLRKWERKGWVIKVCPEIVGGLPVPRPPAEIQMGDGMDVVDGSAEVVDIHGQNVTNAFITGARDALRLVEEHGVECAVLKSRSPSCGSKVIYDGSFSGGLKEGQGVTAALLERNGVQVFTEDEIDIAAALLNGEQSD